MLKLQQGHMRASTLLQGHCLCVFGLVDANVGFRAFWSHLRFGGSHNRPTGDHAVDSTVGCIDPCEKPHLL